MAQELSRREAATREWHGHVGVGVALHDSKGRERGDTFTRGTFGIWLERSCCWRFVLDRGLCQMDCLRSPSAMSSFVSCFFSATTALPLRAPSPFAVPPCHTPSCSTCRAERSCCRQEQKRGGSLQVNLLLDLNAATFSFERLSDNCAPRQPLFPSPSCRVA